MKEIKSLTGVRGVASLYVLIYHFYKFYLYESPSNVTSRFSFHNFLDHGYLGVDFFFILSAFVITLSSRKYFEEKIKFSNYFLFMKKRFIRIYPTYFLVLISCFVFLENFHRLANFLVSITLLNSLLGISYLLQPFWSLSAEWVTYLFYPIIFKAFFYSRSKTWLLTVLFLGIAILYFASALFWNSFKIQPFQLAVYAGFPSLFRCFGNYLLGMFAFRIFHDSKYLLARNKWISLVVAGISVALLFFTFTDMVIVTLFIPIVVCITNENDYLSKLLSSKLIYFLGIVSYPLYLIHAFLATFLKSTLNLITASNFYMYRFPILFILFALLSIGVSWLVVYFIEKPAIKYLNIQIFKKTEFISRN